MKQTDDQNQMPRRRAIVACLRWTVLAAMAIVCGHFLRRKPRSGENACIDPKARLGCRQCKILKQCGQPRALSVKQYLSKQNEKRNA
ncbi:MAG: hypothetical protein ACYTET_06840 [Planctomycetota bacterium]|jgi:hypothetical protein